MIINVTYLYSPAVAIIRITYGLAVSVAYSCMAWFIVVISIIIRKSAAQPGVGAGTGGFGRLSLPAWKWFTPLASAKDLCMPSRQLYDGTT